MVLPKTFGAPEGGLKTPKLAPLTGRTEPKKRLRLIKTWPQVWADGPNYPNMSITSGGLNCPREQVVEYANADAGLPINQRIALN